MAKLGVILGSTRQQRLGERIAQWVLQQVQVHTNDVALLDLKTVNLPFYDEPKSPDALAGRYSHPTAQAWHDTIAATQQLIFVTPEYNHSYPGVLKNAIDYIPSTTWAGKPYVIVSYSIGAFGGVRAAMQMRGLLDYLGLDCQGELNIPLADKATKDTLPTDRLQKLLITLSHE